MRYLPLLLEAPLLHHQCNIRMRNQTASIIIIRRVFQSIRASLTGEDFTFDKCNRDLIADFDETPPRNSQNITLSRRTR
jgi:hypothetical protein